MNQIEPKIATGRSPITPAFESTFGAIADTPYPVLLQKASNSPLSHTFVDSCSYYIAGGFAPSPTFLTSPSASHDNGSPPHPIQRTTIPSPNLSSLAPATVGTMLAPARPDDFMIHQILSGAIIPLLVMHRL